MDRFFSFLSLLPLVVYITSWIISIIAIANWDGKKNCDGDCESCPFPSCKDKDKGE